MKAKTLLVLLLITMIVTDEVVSWRFWRKICKSVCKRGCKWVLRKNGQRKWVCKFACKKICGKKKRQAIELDHNTPLGGNFDFYDLDDDNFVEIDEIAGTLGHAIDEPGLVAGFQMTDLNNDGKLSREEFMGETSAFQFAEPFEGLYEGEAGVVV